MNEQRLQAYLTLIQALLSCPSGKEAEILNTNLDLVDAGLVQKMLEVANDLRTQGKLDPANSLMNLASRLMGVYGNTPQQKSLSSTPAALSLSNPDSQLAFLWQVLMAANNSGGNPQVVYPLLEANLDKLDDNFTIILRDWTTATLPNEEPEQVQKIAVAIIIFSNLIQQFPLGNSATNLEIAITGYEVVATDSTRASYPENWAITQNNLGNAYSNRLQGNRAENLEEAIRCYSNALQVRTRQHYPKDWAGAQNGLGNAYRQRIQGERAENLEKAINCFEAALEVSTRQAFPELWVRLQNNLGAAYRERIQGEKAENIEKAISCFENALEVSTRQVFPELWVRLQNNLGATYLERIRGEKAEHLEKAIGCFDAALQVRTREAFPQDWAGIQNNLGAIYSNRLRGERAENLEKAISYYSNALQVWTRPDFLKDWAGAQNNLGNAYRNRIQGEKAENLEAAIRYYSNALKVWTRQAFPQNWAATQDNLGIAYYERSIQGEKTKNLEAAIGCFLAALEVRTREAFPHDHLHTQFALGSAYRYTQQFSNAYTAFEAAIDTLESLRGEIVSGSGIEEDKQKLAEAWNKLYRRMVAVCVELGYYDKAIEYIERSKTRNLVELLATRNIYPKGKIPEAQQKELQRLRREIDVEKRRLFTDTQPDYTLINQLRQRYNELSPFEPIRFDQIQNLIDDRTAIIQWYIFGDCFGAFLITRHNPQPIIWKSSALDLENLQNWRNGYLEAYYALRQAKTEAEQQEPKKQWQNNITSRLQDLAEILHINDVLKRLSQIPATFDQLILIPYAYLHLLPIHALPISLETWLQFNPQNESLVPHTNPCLLDCIRKGVRYVPSCQLLQQVQQQERNEFQRLFAIQTPTADLYEQDLGAVRAIGKQFANFKSLTEADAKKSKILCCNQKTTTLHEKLLAAHCVLFFCHGYFDFDSPLDSYLLLADDKLSLADIIAHFDLKSCRLVTLSACETGLPQITLSDEYLSLPYGFLLAGSTNVVSTLWPVSATATALLIIRFYDELKQQSNIALALNTAQRWLRDTTVQGFQEWIVRSQLDRVWQRELRKYFNEIQTNQGVNAKPFEQPYYWAAFCAIGKGV